MSRGQGKDTGEKDELCLAAQAKKGKVKAKQNQGGGSSQDKKEKDMSKVKCFGYNKFGILLVNVQTKRRAREKLL